MTRVRLPLNEAAARAATVAIQAETAGRLVDPASETDASLRSRWIAAYAAAGGEVEARPPTTRPLKNPVQTCPRRHIELCYQHADGSPVPQASYVVQTLSGQVIYRGQLGQDGRARIEDVPPEHGSFQFYFQGDPAPFKYSIVPSAKPETEPVRSVLDEVLDWLWGTLQGDFNKEASYSQIAVNALLGLIPLVDQALDLRDLVAGLKDIIEYYREDEHAHKAHEGFLGLDYETWLWVNVFIIALGAIPEVGSAVKGVLRALILHLKSLNKTVVQLAADQLRSLWELLVQVLNYFGKGNAHEWLKQFAGKLEGLLDDAARKIRQCLDRVKGLLAQGEQYARGWITRHVVGEETLAAFRSAVQKVYPALQKAYARLEAKKVQVNLWLKEQVQKLLQGKHHFPQHGAAGTDLAPLNNVRRQEATPPPEGRIVGESEELTRARALLGPDGKFKDPELEAAYQRYLQRKGKAGQQPRDRAEWKVESDYWKHDSPMARGNRFNEAMRREYDYNEVHLENNKRVDSYVPPDPSTGEPGKIVSRKATDFDAIEEDTFKAYLKEMDQKYKPGTLIRSNKYPALDGQPLQGQRVLEVPDSNIGSANQQRFEELARHRGVRIEYVPEPPR